MNWKIIGIVAVAIFALIGVGGIVWAGYQAMQALSPAGQARIQCGNGDPDSSLRGCTNLIQSGKAKGDELANAYLQRGIAHERKQEYDLAIQDDNEVIKLNPRSAWAWNNRGFAYDRKGNHDQAIVDFNQAIQRDPKMIGAWFNRAESYRAKDQYQQSISDLGQVITLQPNNAVAWNNRCYYRAIVHDLDAAPH